MTNEEYFRFVRHGDVGRFEEEGWVNLGPLIGHHGRYSVLMEKKEDVMDDKEIAPIDPGPLVMEGNCVLATNLALNAIDHGEIAEMYTDDRPDRDGYAAWLVRASNNFTALTTASALMHEACKDLETRVAMLVEALDGYKKLTRSAQDILTTYLTPDDYDADKAVGLLLALLDGPHQRKVEGKARAVLCQVGET